ncbi:hypothetical protein FF1_034955 [Malus domestica]
MGLCKISLSFPYILGSALIQLTHAQDTPEDFLNSYNCARATVGIGPLTWEDNIARFAQNHANQCTGDCNIMHSYRPYNENIYISITDLPGSEVVDRWVEEKADYNYESNSCADGKMYEHYRCNYDPPCNYHDEKPY